jgi:enoyl-CoA hydratase
MSPSEGTKMTDTQPADPDVLVERDGKLLVITLNRPSQRNAMTQGMAQLIAKALDELDSNDEIAVGILTGGGGTFCAGMDLKGFLAGEMPTVPGRGFGGLTMAPPAKPLIAAVEGYALAGGFELVLACDLAVAGAGSQFGLPEVRRGLVARGGGLLRLPLRIPRAVAVELILTGATVDGSRAEMLGLVNRVVPDGQALVAAKELAGVIAGNAPLAIQASKRVVTESADWSTSEWFDRQAVIADPVFTSEDAREGAQAFAEKRPANWQGR